MGDALAAVDLGEGAAVSAVRCGKYSTCALVRVGASSGLKCWGANADGQLGYEDTAGRGSEPQQMGGALPFVRLTDPAGADANATVESVELHLATHACVLLSNGGVKCWGDNGAGQLGIGAGVSKAGADAGEMGAALPYVPLPLPALELAVGEAFTCARDVLGQVSCWGDGSKYQLGNYDNAIAVRTPQQAVALGGNASALALGTSHSCARMHDARLKWCAAMRVAHVRARKAPPSSVRSRPRHASRRARAQLGPRL